MSSVPSKGQLKIPTFNTNSCIQPSQLLSCQKIVGNQVVGDAKMQKPPKVEILATTNQRGVIKATYNNGIRMNGGAAVQNVTTNITTTKISVGGKVIDIDVLTKLQQRHQRGNIVSFTASKEFLSNLANSNKMNHVAVQSRITTSEGKVNGTPVIYNSQVKRASVITTTSLPPKAPQEKLLLPKTSQAATNKTYPPVVTNCAVEVKKFAPEINGLLTGLSTALKSSASKTPSSNVVHRGNATKTNNLTPVAINVITTTGKSSNLHKTTLLFPAGNLKEATHPHSTSINTAFVTSQVKLQQKGSAHQTNRTHMPTYTSVQLKSTHHQSIDLITKVNNGQTTKQSNYNRGTNNAVPQMTFSPVFATGENGKRGNKKGVNHSTNKVLRENANNSSNFKIQKLIQDKMGYFARNKPDKIMGNQNKIEHENRGNEGKTEASKVTGFDELYKAAVNNVLNIKTFPGDLATSTNGSSKVMKEFEDEFKQYLETPMDIEQKINDGVFKYFSKKKKFKTDGTSEEPELKKIKLESILSVSSAAETSRSKNNVIKSTARSDTTSLPSKGAFDTSPCKEEVENRKFFSQFLSDQTTDLRRPITREYFSPIDFPWFYPSYYYPGYFVMPPPPPTPTPRQASPSASPVVASTPHSLSDEKEDSEQLTTTTHPTAKGKSSQGQNQRTSMTAPVKSTKPKTKTKTNTMPTKNNDIEKLQSPLKTKKHSNSAKMTSLSSMEETTKETKRKRPERLRRTNMDRPTKTPVPKLVPTRSVPPGLSVCTNTPKKLKQKDNLKFRYSLRQRLKALKKSKKYAKSLAQQEDQPKFVLKKLDKKTSTKKELFLACLGLRRILKRITK